MEVAPMNVGATFCLAVFLLRDNGCVCSRWTALVSGRIHAYDVISVGGAAQNSCVDIAWATDGAGVDELVGRAATDLPVDVVTDCWVRGACRRHP